jgi:predicted transglutaminase-like cysteine proteinase
MIGEIELTRIDFYSDFNKEERMEAFRALDEVMRPHPSNFEELVEKATFKLMGKEYIENPDERENFLSDLKILQEYSRKRELAEAALSHLSGGMSYQSLPKKLIIPLKPADNSDRKVPFWAKIAALAGIASVVLIGAHYYFNVFLPKQEEERLKKTDSDGDGISDWDEVHVYKTDPKKPNPVFKYAIDKGIPIDIAKKLIPLDEDGRMDENEKSLVDYLYNLSRLVLPEEAKAFQAKAVDKILADGKVSSDEAKALTYLSTYSGEINKDYINLGLDGDVIKYLLFTSSLKDQDFAKYAVEIKLCIQDKNLTDLEMKYLSQLSDFHKNYSELTKEITKLPDLKVIDEKDLEAIDDILFLATNPKNKPAFEAMLKEGIPDKRKYCTPLEALLWIAYDEEFDKDNPLAKYSLEKLITKAWRYTYISKDFTSDRWKNFDEVVDRLNSPDLVSIYMNYNIRYKTDMELYGMKNYWASALETFKNKAGDCEDHALFATYCMVNAGHEAYILISGELRTQRLTQSHAVGLYKMNNQFWYLDNCGVKRGPFITIKDAALNICSLARFSFEGYELYDINKRMFYREYA